MKFHATKFIVLSAEKSINGDIYLEMFMNSFKPQLHTDFTDFIFKPNGTPPHFNLEVQNIQITHYHSNGQDVVPKVTFGSSAPPRGSPDLTLCD
jgi:hypothetical protein